MATAYQPHTHNDAISGHWDHSVPADDDPSYHHQNGYGHNPYAFASTNGYDYDAPRDTGRPSNSKRGGNVALVVNTNTTSQDSRYTRDTSSQQRQPSVPLSKNLAPSRKRSISQGMNSGMEDVDNSAWIHRDKLAQIESEEMARAGIRVRHTSRRRDGPSESNSASRAASRSRANSRQPRDRHAQQNNSPEDPASAMLPPFQDRSYNDRQYQDDDDDDDDDMEYDPAMLMQSESLEKAQNPYDRSLNSSVSRPVTSRIPIAKASPAPVSTAVVDRDLSFNRNRHGSNPWNSGASASASPTSAAELAYQKRRSRSQSLGSSVMMEEANVVQSPASTRTRPQSSHLQQSPRVGQAVRDTPSIGASKKTSTKQPVSSVSSRKTGAKGSGTGTGARKTSATRKTSPNSRPVSSSAPRPNPAAKRPEGEAPWIATMYKPDPRLPPDQQILPTHAKRMMQQGGNDGEAGQAYDRDFDALDDTDLAKMGALPLPEDEQPQSAVEEPQSPQQSQPSQPSQPPRSPPPKGKAPNPEQTWPMSRTLSKQSSPTSGGSGGFKITPTIALPAPSPTNQPRLGVQQPVIQAQRLPDMDEKADGKEKGCGCCIVM